MTFLVLVKGIPDGWVSSSLMEDQLMNWESNLCERVGKCKTKLKCTFNVLRLMVILNERHLQRSTLQLNKG